MPVAEASATAAAPAVAGPPPGYRLAGLAVGHPTSFAAIEFPDGNSHLYRVGSKVPGLGRIAAITEAGATIEGEHGRFTLHLKPAATATPDRRRRGERAAGPTPEPQNPADRDDKAREPDA